MNSKTKTLTRGQEAMRVYRFLKSHPNGAYLSDATDDTGLHGATIRSIVAEYGASFAKRLGARSVTYSRSLYSASDSGAFGRLCNARGSYWPAMIDVER